MLDGHAVAESYNASKDAGLRVTFHGAEGFGPDALLYRFTFENGLVLLCEIDSAAPVVALQTWVKVGSRFEKQGKTGISHLFEHLMFGETEETPHGGFDRLLEEAGAENNAATFLDWTYYQQNLPKEALPLGLKLEAGRMAKLVLREPQVTSEKEVVANERRQRVEDDIDGAVSEVLYKEAFKTHAYGVPTIGWMDDIKGFTPEDCDAFYRTYYAPNNATLVLVGDLELGETLHLVGDTLGRLAPSKIPIEDVRPEPPQVQERIIDLEKPTTTHKVSIGYKGPALGDFDYAPLVVLNEILFGGRAGRIHKRLVKDLEIASEVRGWVGTFRDPGLYDLNLVARDGTTAEALVAALDRELADLHLAPPTRAELERAKARLELGTLQSLESTSGRAETIGFYETVLGDPSALFTKLAAYSRVTERDLLRGARRFLVRENRTVVRVAPDGSAEHSDEDPDEDDDLGSETEDGS